MGRGGDHAFGIFIHNLELGQKTTFEFTLQAKEDAIFVI
jgi:hypothetical protein